jgi:rRNA-processing protein FCF1
MDVILDTNILIADIWQKSQNFRFLMDFIKKTNSNIQIPSVVDVEINAFFSRLVDYATFFL